MKVKVVETKRLESHIVLEEMLCSFRSKYFGCVEDDILEKIDEIIEIVSDRNPELDNYGNIDEIEFVEKCYCYKEN